MGLFDFITNQFIEVIEWSEQDRDVLVYRFPVANKEIKNGAQLTVREGQAAVFVNEGKIADVFQPGRYRLSTANTPVLTKLGAWKHGFNSPFKAEVYFVTTRQFTDQKWGTPNPVIVRDPEFGAVRLRAFGNYAFRVEDPATFLKEAVGTDGLFTTEEITGQLKAALVSGFGDLAAESRIPLLDLASHYDELASALGERTQEEFKKFGLVLRRCVIENISVPQEVEQALDRAAGAAAPRDLDRYTRVAAADALRGSAGGEGAGIGAQIAAGLAVGSAMVGAVTPIGAGPRPAPPAGPPCAKCQTPLAVGAKFCANCGEAVGAPPACAGCRTPLPAGAKFCPHCGAASTAAASAACGGCGATLAAGAKFCAGCGQKVA
jgi:membrane protease subunit (stomatin/prohibitin family)